LVVCTGNSMRSQLAEAVLRDELGERIDVVSAGTHPTSVHPLTLGALKEAGLDTSQCRPKSVFEFAEQEFDLVVTLCDSAHLICPHFPHARKVIHRGYGDPIRDVGSHDARAVFAQLRDKMRIELTELVATELKIRRDAS
ncbi:arsenate reductase ArsC, partial [bacterium]|nr:arsenate reductase ArsC [bacterium]